MSIDLTKETRCPMCNHLIATQYTMQSERGDKIAYYLCGCGTIFHKEKVDHAKFNQAYLDKMREAKFFKDKLLLWQRVYLPLIEEHTYGRQLLDVGYGFSEQLDNLKQRGWLTEGIDLIDSGSMVGDFESYDFQGRRFDVLILNHTFASFNEPAKALAKAVSLVRSGGLLLMFAPDTSLCLEFGYGAFGHWSPENKTMMSLDQTMHQLTRLGFERQPLVSIRNLDKRFLYFNDYHLIMRKGLCLEDAKTR